MKNTRGEREGGRQPPSQSATKKVAIRSNPDGHKRFLPYPCFTFGSRTSALLPILSVAKVRKVSGLAMGQGKDLRFFYTPIVVELVVNSDYRRTEQQELSNDHADTRCNIMLLTQQHARITEGNRL